MATEAPAAPKGTTERVEAVSEMAEKDPNAPKGPTAPGSADGATQSAATAWFMSAEEEESAWVFLPVNVAAAGKPEQIVDFKIQVVDRERIRELREQARRVNASGEKEIDEMEANLNVAVEGLIDPPIRTDQNLRTVRGQYYADPADALKAKFAHKPGLIDQIATKISEISGYASGDVKEIRAAGNS